MNKNTFSSVISLLAFFLLAIRANSTAGQLDFSGSPNYVLSSSRFGHFQIQRSNGSANIYIPLDGEQPSVSDVVVWSCANIDTNEQSNITEWYVQMFTENDNIIDLSRVRSKLLEDYQQKYQMSDLLVHPAEVFKMYLRRIAANPIGRALLYRILIEIYKQRSEQRNNATFLQASTPTKLSVRFQASFNYCEDDSSLYFYYTTSDIIVTCIGNRCHNHDKESVVQGAIDVETAIFHELIHWFHYLRDPGRYSQEVNRSDITKFVGPNNGVAQFFYINVIGAGQIKDSDAKSWYSKSHLDLEEMRTILGSTKADPKFLCGDDISENLFRLSRGKQLRFGYSGDVFQVSGDIIANYINILTLHLTNYGK